MLDAYRDLIDELLGTPTEIRALAEQVGEHDISPSAKILIAEMRDRDRAVLERARTITHQQNAYLSDLRLAEAQEYQELDSLLQELESARGDLVSLLINLSLKDWERTAIHESEGEVTLADEVEQHVEFDEGQRARIRKIIAGV